MRRVLFVLVLCFAVVGLTIGALAATGCGDNASVTSAPKYDDGTPEYRPTVTDSYRQLQFKVSIYGELPSEGSGIRLGIYQAQADCGEGATDKNIERMEEAVQIAKAYNVQLLSFPELYVPGYTLDPDEAKQVAEFKDGPSITRAREVARENNMALILPYAEKVEDAQGNMHYYDSIAVISENGELLDSYHKTHLYGQQERDNWSFGDSDYPVHAIFGFPVGVLNCYECEFPELSRILALNGAKLIVGPTAADNYYTLPDGDRSDVPYPDISTILIPANSYSNNIFFAYSNRAGYEQRGGNEWHYRGNSIVCGPYGDIIVAANHEQDTMLIADCIPAYYGMTHPAPDYYYLKDRRPELYEQLVSETADFLDLSTSEFTLDTDFLEGGFTYPSYTGGEEQGSE
jgi:predicted amidohydrolase